VPLIDAGYAIKEAFDGSKQRVKECAFSREDLRHEDSEGLRDGEDQS
jgi:hypothetical protein